MKRRPIVAVMGLHESSLIDHELNTLRITYCETQAKLCPTQRRLNAKQQLSDKSQGGGYTEVNMKNTMMQRQSTLHYRGI